MGRGQGEEEREEGCWARRELFRWGEWRVWFWGSFSGRATGGLGGRLGDYCCGMVSTAAAAMNHRVCGERGINGEVIRRGQHGVGLGWMVRRVLVGLLELMVRRMEMGSINPTARRPFSMSSRTGIGSAWSLVIQATVLFIFIVTT